MSTSVTDANNSSSFNYQGNFQNPQPQSTQLQQQPNGRTQPPFQSNQSSETATASDRAHQVKADVPVVKTEPGVHEQQAQQVTHHNGVPQATQQGTSTPGTQQLPFTGQVSQPASGGFHAHPGLPNPQRVVADYSGPGQAQIGPRPILASSQGQPSFHVQQGINQGLTSQQLPVQTGGQSVGPPAGGPPLAAYPSYVQGLGQGSKPLIEPSSSANGKQVSTGDIQRVQNYIEKCLQMYLTQKEVITQLQQQFKIEPCFTQLVWQKLEEQNQEFFRAYYTRLKLKDQIVLFNHLLDEQVKMFERLPRSSNLMSGGVPAMMNSHSGLPSGLGQQTLQSGPQNSGGLANPGVMMSQPTSLAQVPPGSDASLALHDSSAHQLDVGDFSGLGMDSGSGDLNPDLAALAQSLPFSGSEMNLAGMVSSGSMGRGLGSQDHLAGLPRNFSLSDLGLDQVMDGDHSGLMPRNISLSDFPALDLDSGGEQN